ncbi:putative uncharacterized protein [Firmicutes bacterium CAG:170]|nr:putative uncharacterized protein [Firmicutes bacterium CAG:170]
MVVVELLCRILRQREGIDQLENGLFLLQISVLVAALVEHGDDLGGRFQNFCQPCSVFRFKVDLCHRLLDIGQSEGNILIDGHVGPQSVVLEQEADLALVGRDIDAKLTVKYDLVADGDAAAGRGLEARDHAERCSLAAARRAEQRHEGVVRDRQIQVLDRIEFCPALGDMFQFDFRHDINLLFPCQGLHP